MSGLVLTPKARRDIEDIWHYSVDRWDIAQAQAYVRKLASAIDIIAANPIRGRSCDSVRLHYRKYKVGAHLIFIESQLAASKSSASSMRGWISIATCHEITPIRPLMTSASRSKVAHTTADRSANPGFLLRKHLRSMWHVSC